MNKEEKIKNIAERVLKKLMVRRREDGLFIDIDGRRKIGNGKVEGFFSEGDKMLFDPDEGLIKAYYEVEKSSWIIDSKFLKKKTAELFEVADGE